MPAAMLEKYRKMDKYERYRVFWMVFGVAAFVIFVTIGCVGFIYYKQQSLHKTKPVFWALTPNAGYNVTQLKSQDYLLSVGFGFVSFKPDKGLKLEVDFVPMNKLAAADGTPTVPICVTYRDKEIIFEPGKELKTEMITVPFMGDLNLYPFDTYDGELTIDAMVGDATSNDSCSKPLSISPAVLGTVKDFVINPTIEPDFDDNDKPDYSFANIDFVARRALVVRAFSCFIFLVMWAMVTNLVIITLWTWKSSRRVELGIVAMSAAMMYALPRVRDSQPGVPKMGIIQDLVGYTWQILIVSMCLISLLVNFVIRYKGKKGPAGKVMENTAAVM